MRLLLEKIRWHKTSLIYDSDLNKERLQHQSKLCDSLVNEDYNSFLNRHIFDRLESGDTKPLFKLIANRHGNNNTIKKLDGCNDDSAIDFAECFASAFALFLQSMMADAHLLQTVKWNS